MKKTHMAWVVGVFVVVAVLTVLTMPVWWNSLMIYRPWSLMLFHPSAPLVENGVAMIMVCGEAPKGFMLPTENVSRPRVGWWSGVDRGECKVWYHHPSSGGD